MFVTVIAALLTVWKKQTKSGRGSNHLSLQSGKVTQLLDSMKGMKNIQLDVSDMQYYVLQLRFTCKCVYLCVYVLSQFRDKGL